MSRDKNTIVDELVERYRDATNRDAAFDTAAAARLGVSLTDLHCLNVAERAGGATAGQLATGSGLTTGAVTSVIDRLERAGYAERTRDEHDRRKVVVRVTDHFYTQAADIWGPSAAAWRRELGGSFSVAELKTVARFFEEVAELSESEVDRLRNSAGSQG